MEAAADAVAAILAHDGEPPFLDITLDGVADIAEALAGYAGGDSFFEALAGGVEQALSLGGYFASLHRDIHVAVVAVFFDGDIDGEDITFLHDAFARYAVHDLVVDRYANAAREAAVAQGAGDGVLAADILVGDLVEVKGSDAGF